MNSFTVLKYQNQKTATIFFFCCLLSNTIWGQKKDSADLHSEQNNGLRSDTVNISLKNISMQLINLRDTLGAEIMALDRKLSDLQPPDKINLEKVKCRLGIYKGELEKLIEEVTIADISYITELKKRAYRTVLDARLDLKKMHSEAKNLNQSSNQ